MAIRWQHVARYIAAQMESSDRGMIAMYGVLIDFDKLWAMIMLGFVAIAAMPLALIVLGCS
jgi:hypothetical protein